LNLKFAKAKRLKNIKPSGIRRFFSLAKELPNVIDLTIGEPDFVPPKHALKGCWKALREGKTHYTPTNGLPELREAIAEKMREEYGLKYDSNSEVLVTVGGTEALFLALFGLVNPGDEVLVPNPGFVCYEPDVCLADGVPVHFPLLESAEFKPRVSDVMSLVTEKSRVIILNFPNNPTGSALSYDETAALAEVAVKRDLLVISDEVYERIVYDDTKHHCLATLPGMRERTLIVNSFSKTYAMTGLRIGFVCGPEELISPLWLVHQFTVACVNSASQYAALVALKGQQKFVKDMVREFDRRRRLVYKRLNEIDGFKCVLPKGAFYAFPNIKGFKVSSEKFAEFILKEAKVAVVPGSVFGSYGEGYIRISYATAYEPLEAALNRIERAVKKLRK